MPWHTTARERRSAARASLARFLTRTLARLDLTQARLAEECGVRPSKVQLWCDHHRADTISVADLRNAPREVALDLCRWALQDHHARIVDDLDGHDAAEAHALLAQMTASFGRFAASKAEALADGRIDDTEARALAPPADDLADRVLAARESYRERKK